jgi:hypothetical protein
MGQKILAFTRLYRLPPDVYRPVNYRPTEICHTLVFDPTDGNNYHLLFDAVGIQYALGETYLAGYHVIETPDSIGPLLRYTRLLPDGCISVRRHKSESVGCVYQSNEVRFIGFAFQFIHDFETGDRWEFIRGPAHAGEDEGLAERPLYEVSG